MLGRDRLGFRDSRFEVEKIGYQNSWVFCWYRLAVE